jgi:putative phosphonate metabolism protein
MSDMRLALYWAPEVVDPLHAAASAWLGRDAESGATLVQPEIPGLDLPTLTADPRGYGFHATLKPPFRLATDYPTARAAALALAGRTAPFALPPLSVQNLDGFLALRESEPCPALHAFADACVTELDPHRAPPTAEELLRRRPERLPEAERALLERWGYPHVLSAWRFHMTLSKRLAEEQMAILRPAAEAALNTVAAAPRMVRELCLFTQAGPGAPFLIGERLPLKG